MHCPRICLLWCHKKYFPYSIGFRNSSAISRPSDSVHVQSEVGQEAAFLSSLFCTFILNTNKNDVIGIWEQVMSCYWEVDKLFKPFQTFPRCQGPLNQSLHSQMAQVLPNVLWGQNCPSWQPLLHTMVPGASSHCGIWGRHCRVHYCRSATLSWIFYTVCKICKSYLHTNHDMQGLY